MFQGGGQRIAASPCPLPCLFRNFPLHAPFASLGPKVYRSLGLESLSSSLFSCSILLGYCDLNSSLAVDGDPKFHWLTYLGLNFRLLDPRVVRGPFFSFGLENRF